MIHVLKKILKNHKKQFTSLCRVNSLELEYAVNKNELQILKSIFQGREYADYFPFYQKVNVIDIGAHYGYFSIFAAKNVAAGSKLISIEPNRTNFAGLQQNIKACKLENVIALHLAISGESGSVELFDSRSVNHSLFRSNPLVGKAGSGEKVTVKTLDQIIEEEKLERVHFLKMDCEGAEYSIFKHASKQTLEKVDRISMEFHDLKDPDATADFIISKLSENKFRIVKFQYEPTSMNLNYGKIIGIK